MKATSERVPITRRLLRSVLTWAQRARCFVLGHKMITVTERRGGVQVQVPLCDRCPHIDYTAITTSRWNRNARRRAARQLARRMAR